MLREYTKGRFDLRVGHEYIGKAFAEFFDSALANSNNWKVLNKFLPTTSKIFEAMLDELIK